MNDNRITDGSGWWPKGEMEIGERAPGAAAQRLKAIHGPNSEEVRVLASFIGDASVERMLHRVFRRDRIRGEWFMRSSVLAEFIARLTKVNRID